LLCLIAIGAVAAARAHQTPIDLQSLLTAYAAGDRDVISKSIHTTMDLRQVVPLTPGRRIDFHVNDKEPWTRTKALFFTELAAFAIDHRWMPELATLPDAAASYLVRRPDPPGRDLDGDVFERQCHAIILAAYQGALAPDYLNRYVNNWILPKKAPRPDDPRFKLAQAIALEQGFLPSTLVRLGVSQESTLLIGKSSVARQLAVNAMLAFKNLTREETTRAEASVRLGFILYRDAKPEDALPYLKAADSVDDATLQYWGKLFSGRAYDALGRVDEARQQYAAADAASPGAQSARVALAALDFRSDKRDDALVNVKRILAAPSDVEDPWRVYWLGQHRFLKKWIENARGQLK
jgi:tetratricopeptide (TPR) repeat protein